MVCMVCISQRGKLWLWGEYCQEKNLYVTVCDLDQIALQKGAWDIFIPKQKRHLSPVGIKASNSVSSTIHGLSALQASEY